MMTLMSGLMIFIGAIMVIGLYGSMGMGVFKTGSRLLPSVWFSHGITMGFVAVAINALFWKLGYRLTVMVGSEELSIAYSSYGGWADLTVSVLTIWAAFCHLYSAWLNLDKVEKYHWHWFTMPWHPRHNPMTRLLHFVLRTRPEQKE